MIGTMESRDIAALVVFGIYALGVWISLFISGISYGNRGCIRCDFEDKFVWFISLVWPATIVFWLFMLLFLVGVRLCSAAGWVFGKIPGFQSVWKFVKTLTYVFRPYKFGFRV